MGSKKRSNAIKRFTKLADFPPTSKEQIMKLRNGKLTRRGLAGADTDPMGKVIIVYREMEDAEASFVISSAKKQLRETPEWTETSRVLVRLIENELGGYWTCIVGGYLGLTTTYLRNHFLHVIVYGVTVIVFKMKD